MLHSWYQRYRVHSAQAFDKNHSVYSAKFKLSALKQMKKHQLSYRETAAYLNLRGGHSVVIQWQRLYVRVV